MKKTFLFLALSIGLCMMSCTKEETSTIEAGESQVSLSIGLENVIGSRAISDGTGADKLVYAVFDEQGARLTAIKQVSKTGVTFPTTETIALAKGKSYKVAFWAQDSDCEAYSIDDDMNVTINYEGDNNDETRDAFFACVDVRVTGDITTDVILRRPFAQLNLGVTQSDWSAAEASGFTTSLSSVTMSDAANEINLVTGKVSGSTEVTYALSSIPTESLKVDTDGDGTKEDYKYLSMSYFLVDDPSETGSEKATMGTASFKLQSESGNEIVIKEGLNNIPVRRNYRTNIVGQMLSSNISFKITIDPSYEGEYNGIPFGLTVNGKKYKTFAEAVAAVNASTDETNFSIELLGDNEWATGNAGNGNNMMFANSGATVTISGGSLTATGSGGIKNAAKVIFKDMTIIDKTSYAYENGETAWEFTYLEFQGTGSYEFNDCVFNNTVMFEANANVDNCTFLGKATLESNAANEYAAWITTGNVNITNSKFESKYRGLKIADKYGSAVKAYSVVVDNCQFTDLSKKPGVAIDNANTAGAPFSSIIIKNCTFTEVQPGDQKAYIYETDNTIPTLEKNVVAFATAKGLRGFANCVNATEKPNSFNGYTIELAADIDLENELWVPIGQTGKAQFIGTFDGKGHTIKNLKVVNDGVTINTCASGLFGWLNTSVIKNLNIDGADVTGHHYTGVIAGYMESIPTCSIENCHVNNAKVQCTYGSSDADGDKCGGIVGYAGNGGTTVKDCTVKNTSIKAGRDAGQVAGCSKTDYVTGCSASNVTVEWTNEANTTGKNINNDIIGRKL